MTPQYIWAKLVKKLRGTAIINSKIHKTSKAESGSHIVNSTFGRHSYCGYDCEIINCDIGSFCSIANNVVIGGGMHPMEWVSMSPVFFEGRDSVKTKYSTHQREETKRTNIDHDVWIGENALIKQGITVGTGAVIGMGSVVTKDVEPYAIVAGCPAKVIRKRFDDEMIHKLLSMQWWDWPDEKLSEKAQYVNNVRKFIEMCD